MFIPPALGELEGDILPSLFDYGKLGFLICDRAEDPPADLRLGKSIRLLWFW